jgi:hypothetical protein
MKLKKAEREVCSHAMPINWFCKECARYSFDEKLESMREIAEGNVQAHDPSSQSHTMDAYLRGKLHMIEEIIAKYKYGN